MSKIYSVNINYPKVLLRIDTQQKMESLHKIPFL